MKLTGQEVHAPVLFWEAAGSDGDHFTWLRRHLGQHLR